MMEFLCGFVGSALVVILYEATRLFDMDPDRHGGILYPHKDIITGSDDDGNVWLRQEGGKRLLMTPIQARRVAESLVRNSYKAESDEGASC